MREKLVNEKANQSLDLFPVAICDVSTENDVIVSGVTTHQQIERGDYRHEQRCWFASTQLTQCLRGLRINLRVIIRTTISLDQRAWLVRGQLDNGRGLGSMLSPVIELRLEYIALQPVPLPGGEICVLYRKSGKPERFVAGKCGIQCREFANQDAERPSIRNNVMHR